MIDPYLNAFNQHLRQLCAEDHYDEVSRLYEEAVELQAKKIGSAKYIIDGIKEKLGKIKLHEYKYGRTIDGALIAQGINSQPVWGIITALIMKLGLIAFCSLVKPKKIASS